jgi:hypothetical protein
MLVRGLAVKDIHVNLVNFYIFFIAHASMEELLAFFLLPGYE